MANTDKGDIEKVFQKKVTLEDLKSASEKADEIIKKVEAGFLEEQIAKVKLLIRMIKDYKDGKYRELPWYTISAIVIVLLYILNPIDLVPDFIPVAGQLDDLLVLITAWKLIEQDVKRYALWKIKQGDREVALLAKEAFGEDFSS